MRPPHEKWAAQRKAARSELEKTLEAELAAGSTYIDAMAKDLAAGRDVEPFQFSEQSQKDVDMLRSIEWFDRRMLELDEDGRD